MISQLKFGVAALALFLAGCASAPAAPASASRIVSTTSFGMCVGYCTTRLELSEGQAVLIRQARGGRGVSDLPDQRFTATLTAAEWQEISRLAASIELDSLPPVIGCPDCADGGAETLSINDGRPISFDFNASLTPAQPLLDRVRAIRTRLTPEQ